MHSKIKDTLEYSIISEHWCRHTINQTLRKKIFHEIWIWYTILSRKYIWTCLQKICLDLKVSRGAARSTATLVNSTIDPVAEI